MSFQLPIQVLLMAASGVFLWQVVDAYENTFRMKMPKELVLKNIKCPFSCPFGFCFMAALGMDMHGLLLCQSFGFLDDRRYLGTTDSQFERMILKCYFSCPLGHCSWQHWVCSYTSHQTQLTGNKPGGPSRTHLLGNSLTMAVTLCPWVRHVYKDKRPVG